MNQVYLIGEINKIKYGLVDKGDIYAIAIIDLKIEKNKNEIKIICQNEKADYIYRFAKQGTRVNIEGNLRNVNNSCVVLVKDIELC